jgi:large subunit ribosomal protein L28
MSRICFVCDKRPQVGNSVSHAKNRVKRWLYPNVHKLTFKMVSGDNTAKVHRAKVCTRCVRAGKVQKIV